MSTKPRAGDHICAAHAVCFQCFRAGMEKVRQRRQAWAQRSLPFEESAPTLTPRAVAHREKMLEHLALLAAGNRW
jgi:hypothetical protein